MLILYGASGHGKVIMEILEANNLVPDAVWDDAPKDHFLGHTVYAPSFTQTRELYDIIISIGDNSIRRKIALRIKGQCRFITAVHPTAMVSQRSTIGAGSVVMPGVIINADSRIGAHCILNTQCVVEHDCIVSDFAHISPHATLCGNVQIGEGTHVGAGATIIPGVKIGAGCIIGAGSVVIGDVPDNVLVAGNPGKIKKQIV